MIAHSPTTGIFIHTQPTDMRKGFCGLSAIVMMLRGVQIQWTLRRKRYRIDAPQAP